MTIPHRRVATIVLATVTAALGLPLWGGGSANATEVTLRYQCSVLGFPAQPMTAQITWNGPAAVPVGQPTPVIPFTATTNLGDIVTPGFIGPVTVEGSVDTSAVVVAPEGNLPKPLSLTVPRTAVPASGPLIITADGRTPQLVFNKPGPATITVDSGLTVNLVVKDSNGNTLGQGDASCTLDSGQNDVLTSFQITAPPPPPPPPIPPGPATGGTGGSTKSRATGPAATTSASPERGVVGSNGPGGSNGTAAAALASGATTSDPPGTGPSTSVIIDQRLAVATAAIVRRDVVDPRLAGVGFLVVGTALLLGCVRLLRRRRGH